MSTGILYLKKGGSEQRNTIYDAYGLFIDALQYYQGKDPRMAGFIWQFRSHRFCNVILCSAGQLWSGRQGPGRNSLLTLFVFDDRSGTELKDTSPL